MKSGDVSCLSIVSVFFMYFLCHSLGEIFLGLHHGQGRGFCQVEIPAESLSNRDLLEENMVVKS